MLETPAPTESRNGVDPESSPDDVPTDEVHAPEGEQDEPSDALGNDQGTENAEPTPAEDEDAQREQHSRGQRQPTLVQRFRAWMGRSGYTWHEGSGTLVEASSSAWVRKATDLPIWTKHAASGEELEHLWVAQGSLEVGVEIPAHVWRFFENKPGVSAPSKELLEVLTEIYRALRQSGMTHGQALKRLLSTEPGQNYPEVIAAIPNEQEINVR